MIRRLLRRLFAWLTRPFYDTDDPLEEYWSRKRKENERTQR